MRSHSSYHADSPLESKEGSSVASKERCQLWQEVGKGEQEYPCELLDDIFDFYLSMYFLFSSAHNTLSEDSSIQRTEHGISNHCCLTGMVPRQPAFPACSFSWSLLPGFYIMCLYGDVLTCQCQALLIFYCRGKDLVTSNTHYSSFSLVLSTCLYHSFG